MEQESKELFEASGSEPLHWLENAHGLKYSAETLRDRLMEIRKKPPSQYWIETLGLMKSILLLLGLALENLIKGVYVAQHSGLVDQETLDRSLWKSDGGHGISDFARGLLPLTDDETELLNRLQEHIVWAGRYPVPTKATRFHGSRHPVNKRKLNSADFGIADKLFGKLEKALVLARDKSA